MMYCLIYRKRMRAYAQKATQNGYVEVETTDINGVTRSTTDARPVIRHIDNISQLEEAASTVIVNYIRNSIMD